MTYEGANSTRKLWILPEGDKGVPCDVFDQCLSGTPSVGLGLIGGFTEKQRDAIARNLCLKVPPLIFKNSSMVYNDGDYDSLGARAQALQTWKAVHPSNVYNAGLSNSADPGDGSQAVSWDTANLQAGNKCNHVGVYVSWQFSHNNKTKFSSQITLTNVTNALNSNITRDVKATFIPDDSGGGAFFLNTAYRSTSGMSDAQVQFGTMDPTVVAPNGMTIKIVSPPTGFTFSAQLITPWTSTGLAWAKLLGLYGLKG